MSEIEIETLDGAGADAGAEAAPGTGVGDSGPDSGRAAS